MGIWYNIWWSFVTFLPIWHAWTKKNLATLQFKSVTKRLEKQSMKRQLQKRDSTVSRNASHTTFPYGIKSTYKAHPGVDLTMTTFSDFCQFSAEKMFFFLKNQYV
jgi:hypothetical protein